MFRGYKKSVGSSKEYRSWKAPTTTLKFQPPKQWHRGKHIQRSSPFLSKADEARGNMQCDESFPGAHAPSHQETTAMPRCKASLQKRESSFFLATYESSSSLIAFVSSQSSVNPDFRLFRLAAAVGFLRPFNDPDLPSGILDF